MKTYSNLQELQSLSLLDKKTVEPEIIDSLVYTANFAPQLEIQKKAFEIIRKIAEKSGAVSSSIHFLYMAFGEGKLSGFTVPACNIRTLTYDTAQIVFQLMKDKNIGPVIFELARSEMGYTNQPPHQYSASILGAALKSGWQKPVFIQGDHFQFKKEVYDQDPQIEINKIKKLIKESIESGFYNIDIDASTLVDLSKKDLLQQQKENYKNTALITKYIRSIESQRTTVSIGGEIGHIGGKNSTIEDFEAFMKGYENELKQHSNLIGISKVSIQTGTSHGGIPLPDGTIARVNLDFDVLKRISQVAREKYHLGGPVQHGASTLPDDLFDKFPKTNTLEIHLATGFQNIVYNYLPEDLKNKIYSWIKENLQDEWKKDQTESQFIYKTRKKALGYFKKELWDLPNESKQKIMKNLKKKFNLLFRKLNVFNTKDLVKPFLKEN